MREPEAESDGTTDSVFRRGSGPPGDGKPESMDDAVRGDSPRRHRADDGPVGSENAEPAAWEEELTASALAEENRPDLSETVSICGWCKELNILRLQRRDADALIVYQHGKQLAIFRNGVKLTVSHGICEPCRAKHFPPRRTGADD